MGGACSTRGIDEKRIYFGW